MTWSARPTGPSAVFFINFNVNDDWLASAVGEEDKSIEENLVPLAGFGVTAWKDGDYRPLGAAADDRLIESHDRPIRAVVAPVTATRSAGAISRSSPRRPADTNTVSWSRAPESTTVRSGRF